MNPWDQRKDESARYYAWFLAYRDLPPADRNVAAAYRAIKPGAKNANGQFWAMYERFDWVARAQAWDRETQKKLDEARETARRDQIEKFRADLLKEIENSEKILHSLQAKTTTIVLAIDATKIEPDLKNATLLVAAVDRALKTTHDLRASLLGLDELARVADETSTENHDELSGDER